MCANVHFRRRGAGQACHNPRDTDTDGQPQTDHQSLQVSNCKFPRRLRVGIVHINVPLFSPTYPSDRERRTSNMTKTNLIQKKNMTKTKFPSTKVSPARLSSIFYNQTRGSTYVAHALGASHTYGTVGWCSVSSTYASFALSARHAGQWGFIVMLALIRFGSQSCRLALHYIQIQ